MDPKTFIWVGKAILGLAKHIPAKEALPVLIVENDTSDAELLASYVKSLGSDAKVVHTLEAAEDLISIQNFRMVLLDIHFPTGDGIAFAKKVRVRHPKLPVIFVTGYVADLGMLPGGRKWSFVGKGSDGASLKEGIQDAMLEANGVNGYTQPQAVIIVAWLLSALSFVLGLTFHELTKLIQSAQ